jgi:hypothetical protein
VICHSRFMKQVLVVGVAALCALVVAGFILAGYMDATGASSIPGIWLLRRLPHPVRIVVEIVIGVPLALGAALYVISQLFEMLWVVSWPVRKVVELARRS